MAHGANQQKKTPQQLTAPREPQQYHWDTRVLSNIKCLCHLSHLPPLCHPAGTILRSRRISSVALFGVMVELVPGKTGLVHLSELGAEGQVLHEVPPEFKVRPGGGGLAVCCGMETERRKRAVDETGSPLGACP